MTAAAKFAAKGQHDRAAKEYVSVIEADPSDTRTWLLLAEALTNAGDKPGAIERYLHVAEGYAGSNEAQKAIAVYRKVLGLDPNRLDIQTRIAGLYKDLGRIGDAVAAYEFVAQAYFQAGLIAEGLEGFRMVAELEPAAVGKRLRLAELYSREGMVSQAVEHFRLAADRLLADRRTDDYIRVAERLIYHKEDDLPVLRSLAQIYLKQGENRRALVKLNALLRAAPADAEGLELLGETFVAIGKVDKAISVVMELAREQRKGGRKNKETAARVLRKALAWNPENADDIRKIAGEIEAEVAALPPDPEPKDAAASEPKDEGMDLDVDVVEDDAGKDDLDLDVDVEEDEERKVEEVPSRPFAPVGANVAPSVVEDGEESVGDVEKVLLEARVYVKYKMFEHALGHLDAVFVRDANHVPALDLQAQILVELGRNADAADTYVRLAQLVSADDPRQARAHLEQAQRLVPDHTKAEMVLAALDSGGSGETAPLVSGMQSSLHGDPATSATTPEPTDELPVAPAVDTAVDTTDDRDIDDDLTPSPRPIDGKDEQPSQPVPEDSKPERAETSAAGTPPTADANEPSTSDSPTNERPAADSSSTDPAASEHPGETSAARKPPTDDPDANVSPTETSGARKPPSEDSSANRQPTEGSGARKLPTEDSSASRLPTEGSGARKLPTERTPLPIGGPLIGRFGEKTPLPKGPLPGRFGEKTPLPTFKPPPATDASADTKPESEGETDADKPAAKPARARPITLKPQRKQPAKPAPSPEIEELDSAVIEELDVDEVAEVVEVVETPAAPPVRKGPPSRPKPPAKRPPAPKARPPKPPGKAAASEDSKSQPVPEDSKAEAAPEDSKSQPVPEDSKAEAAPEDSKSQPVPEDSKAEAAPEDSKSQPVPEDSKAEAPEDSKSQPVPEDSRSQPVPEDSKSQPVPEDSKPASEDRKTQSVPEDSKPAPEDSKTPPAPEISKPASEDRKTQPVPEASKPASEDSKNQPVPEDSKTQPVPEASKPAPEDSKTQPVPEDGKTDPTSEAGKSPASPEDATPGATPAASEPQAVPAIGEPDASREGRAAEADRTEPVPEDSKPVPEDSKAADPATKPPGQPSPDEAANATDKPATPTGPDPGDTAALAIDAVLAAEVAWPDITDEVEELRFFISGRFEDDAQFAFLDLQRRFPGHPALAEFSGRLATATTDASAAAPVMLDEPAPRPAAKPTAQAPTFDEDEDTFLASIFDEPVSAAPSKSSAKPRRAVAALDDGGDPQTFFDLGTAYREMGLDDDALTQFELAAKDPRWTARARIMMASLRIQRGETDQALRDLDLALEFATDQDQRSEAGYELGVLYQTLGDKLRATEALSEVAEGYRDRDERLKALGG